MTSQGASPFFSKLGGEIGGLGSLRVIGAKCRWSFFTVQPILPNFYERTKSRGAWIEVQRLQRGCLFCKVLHEKKENTGFGSIFWFILNLPTLKNPPKKVPSFFLGCERDKNIRWLYANSFLFICLFRFGRKPLLLVSTAGNPST
jgi:hypothetical protein